MVIKYERITQMKIKLLSLALSTFLLTLTSCGLSSAFLSRTELLDKYTQSGDEIAEGILLEILDALERKDGEALKKMLSEEALGKAEDLDEDIQSVLDYYKGTHIEYTTKTPTSGSTYDKGKKTRYEFSSRFEVMTEVGKYYFSVSGRTISDDSPEQLGLKCIQITKVSDDFFFAYGVYVVSEKRQKVETPKPYIIPQSASARIELLKKDSTISDSIIAEGIVVEILDALDRKDGEALKKLLSEETLSETKNIDEDIQSVLDYYEGTHTAYWGDKPRTLSAYGKGGIQQYHISSIFSVRTESDTYCIAIYGKVIDDENPEMVGLSSLQIVKYAEEVSWSSDLGIYVLTEKASNLESDG
jgi:hypothetical protein